MNPIQVKHETFKINQIDYLIRSLKDRQQFFDKDKLAETLGISSATWPLFGIVWPASEVLATTVCLINLEGKRVLEIGCGIALTSIVLHKMGVDITASDYHPLTREFLDENILNNELSPIKYQVGNWEVDNPHLGKFDMIIGSDILYEPAHAANASSFIDSHSNDDIEVLIIDPNRANRSKFTREMTALGYSHRFEKFDQLMSDDSRCKGRVLHYQRHRISA